MTHFIDAYFRFLKFLVVFFWPPWSFSSSATLSCVTGFNSGITVSEEVSRWAFVWLTFTGAIIAMRENTHLGMDTVVSRLPKLGKQICYVLSHLIMLFCVILFATGSWEQTLINIGVEAAATGISSGFFYGVGLFFCAPAAFILLYDLYRMLSGQLQEKELIRVKELQEELSTKARSRNSRKKWSAARNLPIR